MAKFRAPSASLASIASTPTRNTHAQPQRPHTTSRRARAHKLDKAKAAVKDAAKRVHRTKQFVEPCIAYVGNVGPDVDEKALIAHFSCCGNVLSAKIHCCGGVAMTVKPPPASYHQNMRVRQYAILVFDSRIARHRACKLGGTLGGRELTVSVAISDLPEVREKIVKRLDDYRSRLEPPDPHRAQKSALGSLKLEPTVLLDPQPENERKLRRRFQFMGLTFREGIM
ncbi:hypothetical protein J3R83DRAFT_963 [Lanmaoa asiatica]|nr:hypothetical protein J3R83DRAFT_963 [Lanmaoa asiatica]